MLSIARSVINITSIGSFIFDSKGQFMFYAKSTGGFYNREIHGSNIPSDAVEITDEEYTRLLQGQQLGKIIIANVEGYPELVLPPALTPAQLKEQVNSQARAYLDSTDWYVIRLQETGVQIPQEILDLRRAARESVIED